MRRFSNLLVLTSLLLVCNLTAQQTATTSVPNLIRYSGTLKNMPSTAATNPAPIGVTFAIYGEQNGGAPIWQETQNVTLDASGQYSVLLGSTTAVGLPDDLFSQQEQRWLGVQVQGQDEQPRVMLVSVPYAFKAHEADTLGGLPPSAFVKAAPAEGQSGSSDATALNGLSNASSGGGSSKGKDKAPAIKAPCVGNVTTSTGAPPDAIPMWGTLCGDLANTPASGTAVLNGNLNLAGASNYYAIAGNPVLRVPMTLLSTSPTNLSVGAGTGSGGGYNTFSGFNAGHSNAPFFAVLNTFTGSGAGYGNSGSYNSYHGAEAGNGNSGSSFNTFSGAMAGFLNSGSNNTFSGYQSGYNNTADGNSLYGYNSGMANTSGVQNTFVGYQTGIKNTVGVSNVFVGYNAGQANVTESSSTYVGANAGFSATVGANTFLGYSAGSGTTTGSGNTAVGYDAGRSNTMGFDNVYLGANAGFNINGATATGRDNVYIGVGAGSSDSGVNYTRNDNTFIGSGAGFSHSNTIGGNNILIGAGAGAGETTNIANNIEIGNTGPSAETPGSNQIIIGTVGTQTDTYIAGIYGATPEPMPFALVCIDSHGKLWSALTTEYPFCDIIVSSERFKEQVRDMGDSSNRLLQLRPVSFFYKSQYDDGSHHLQYGLIAEEVAKIFPEMVVYDKTGLPLTVKYNLLAPMLLNEVQKMHAQSVTEKDELQAQLQQIKDQRQEIDRLKRQLQQQNAALQERLSKLESYVATQRKLASDNPAPTTVVARDGQ